MAFSSLRLASSPEYRLCGRSLRTAMPNAFFCPTSTTSFLARVIPRVDEVALEQHVVLGGQRDHHRRELRPLRLVDCHCLREGEFVQSQHPRKQRE